MKLLNFIVCVLLELVVSRAATSKPNFIVIMADDIGASELGGYGHATHRTPHLDQLGRTGVQFDTCFTAPVCHTTRFTLMTGQYGFRTGVLNFSGKRAGPLRKNEGADNIANHLTFAQPLKAAGYATAMAGKWQLSGPGEGGAKAQFGGNWVNVLEKTADGWRVLLHTWN